MVRKDRDRSIIGKVFQSIISIRQHSRLMVCQAQRAQACSLDCTRLHGLLDGILSNFTTL